MTPMIFKTIWEWEYSHLFKTHAQSKKLPCSLKTDWRTEEKDNILKVISDVYDVQHLNCIFTEFQ